MKNVQNNSLPKKKNIEINRVECGLKYIVKTLISELYASDLLNQKEV